MPSAEENTFETLVNGDYQEANQIILEKLSVLLMRNNLPVTDQIRIIQEYRTIRRELEGLEETDPLNQILAALQTNEKNM